MDPILKTSGGSKITNKLIKLPFTINIISFDLNKLKDIAHSLIELIFYPQDTERFFSIIINSPEVGIYIEKKDAQKLISNHPSSKSNIKQKKK